MIGIGPLGSVPLGSIPSSAGGAVPPPLVLRIGGDDTVAKYLQIFEYSIQKELNARDTFDCTLITNDGYRPRIGDEIVLTCNGVRQFAGTINDKEEKFLAESEALWRSIHLTATDWNQILDRRTAVAAYEQTWAGDIVKNLIDRHLAVEGITAGAIEPGLVLVRANWNHEPIATVLDDLAKDVGYYWFVDYYKRLHFLPREAATAPFSLNETNSRVRDFTVRESRNDYRNTQIIKGWKEITNPQTETFRGDGDTRTFTLSFPVYSTPTLPPPSVKLNGQPKTVGVRGVEEGKDFYYSADQNEISQDQGADIDPLTDQDLLEVTYIGSYPGITYQQDAAEVTARQAIEGGSGMYEAVDVDASLEGGDVVIARGAGLLRQNRLSAEAEFETEDEGLDIGQLIPVDFPTLGLSAVEMLITSLELTQISPDVTSSPVAVGLRRYRISCTSGEVKNHFKEFWMRFAQTGQKVGVREGEIVQYPVPMADGCHIEDDLTAPTTAAHDAVVDIDEVEFAEIG